MWLATRARITGHSHVRKGLPCQDFAESQVLGDCMVSIVADGASSAPLGEIGASIAVEAIKKYFGKVPPTSLFHMSEQVICSEIKQCFDFYLERKIRELTFPTYPLDYAATVAFIAIYEKYDTFCYGVIGDCAVATITNYGEIYTISSFSNNQRPHFISDNSFSIQFGHGKLSDYGGFILTTDGCAKGGLISLNNHFDAEVVTAIFENLPLTQNPETWLASFINKNIAQFTPDDLSMYIIYPEPTPLLGSRTVRNLSTPVSCPPPIQNFCISIGGLSSKTQKEVGAENFSLMKPTINARTEKKETDASECTESKRAGNAAAPFEDLEIKLVLLGITGFIVLTIILMACLGGFYGLL